MDQQSSTVPVLRRSLRRIRTRKVHAKRAGRLALEIKQLTGKMCNSPQHIRSAIRERIETLDERFQRKFPRLYKMRHPQQPAKTPA